jgi:peptidoglycan hydrolase CwlO-like protein
VEADLVKAKKDLTAKTAEISELSKKRDSLEVKVKELTSDLESTKNEIKACKVEHDSKISSQKKEQEASLKQKLAD